MSVGEFAAFSLGPSGLRTHPGGRWRMEVGSQWHQTLQAQLETEILDQPDTEARFEVPIEGILRLDRWSLALSGRIDQVLIQPDTIIFREIKSIRQPLPTDEHALEEAFPSYFAQLATYLTLAGLVEAWRGQSIRGELVFVDIDEGISQTIPLEPDHASKLMEERKSRLNTFLSQRADARTQRRTLQFQTPFPELRPGQEETRQRLRYLAARHSLIFFEAPTGYGKTGTLLEYALERLREGLFDRVLYLTGKSTGQIQVARQLESMLGSTSGIRYLQMRNRAEHVIAELPADYFARRAQAARWEEARIDPAALFQGPSVDLEAIKRIGRTSGVEPYSITKALLPYADVWIGDYNYAFAPRIRQTFGEIPGFAPERSLLVIDEAHNLSDRVADSLSSRLDAADAHAVAAQLQLQSWPPRFVRAVQNLAAFLDTLRPAECLTEASRYEGAGLIREIAQAIQSTPLPWEEIDAFALDWLWELPTFAHSLDQADLAYLSWVPKPGIWAHTCLDAGPEIAPVLRSFAQTVLMSATLYPVEALRPRLGLRKEAGDPEGAELEALAPWREGAYRVAIDARVDTRYQVRDRSYPTTARTISQAAIGQTEPVAVFFSSYAYAGKIADYLTAIDPFLRVAIAPRRLDLAAQTRFIEEALISAHVIFLVLGTGFTEGIDLLGGRIQRALVIGPALPEVNAVTRAGLVARERHGRNHAFREVFQIPAMTKINQALGRLVRGPGQRAEVLLHGVRFTEESYQNLLPPAYQTSTILRSESEVLDWWAQGGSPWHISTDRKP